MTDETDWHLVAPDEKHDPHEALKKWERLRLLYNAILIPYVLILAVAIPKPWRGDPFDFWLEVGFGGIVSNICFCLGPVLECYLVWLGASAHPVRIGLFVLGTAFTAVAALAAILL